MLYKKLVNGDWLVAESQVSTLKSEIVNETNQIDGWKWYDKEPKEYTEWFNSQVIAADIELKK